MTLWFVETGEEPFETVHSQFELTEVVVAEGKRPDISRCILLPELIVKCWDADPDKRPKFSAIAATIGQTLSRSTAGTSIAPPSIASAVVEKEKLPVKELPDIQ